MIDLSGSEKALFDKFKEAHKHKESYNTEEMERFMKETSIIPG